jgi:hypothetical protein
MNPIARRIAEGLVAFRQQQGVSLTQEVFDALIDQMAWACLEITGEYERFPYEDFCQAANTAACDVRPLRKVSH